MKYKKKPLIVEAMRFTLEDKDRVFNWITCNRYPDFDRHGNPLLKIETLEGHVVVNLGDWVIKGVAGEFYPVKNDVFLLSYEAIDE